VIEYVSDHGVSRYTYLNSLTLMYGYNHISANFQVICSCCSIYEMTHTETVEQAEIWLEIKFNEYKEKITEDGKYFIHSMNDDTFFVGEMATNTGIELSKAVIAALYEGMNA